MKIISIQLHHCPLDWQINKQWTDYTLWIPTANQAQIKINNKQTIQTSTGDAFLYQPNIKYHGIHDPIKPLKVWVVHFEIDSNLIHIPFNEPIHIQNITFLKELMQRIQLGYIKKDGSGIFWLSVLLKMLQEDNNTRIKNNTNPTEKRLQRLANEIMLTPSSFKDGCIEDLAQSLSLSTDHFTRIFKKTIGSPPKKFIIHNKCRRSKNIIFKC